MDIINNDFKTIQIVCYNSAIDQKKSRVHRYLLSKLIIAQTNQYKTKLAISVKLEALYGALLSARTELNGNINTLSVSMTIADPKMVGDETLLFEAISFFKSVIKDHDHFDQDIFEDEKRQLIEQWKTLKDNKAQYANYRFNEIFRQPDLTGYPLTGSLTDIRKITVNDIEDYYRHVFLKEDMHIIVNGNLGENNTIHALDDLTNGHSVEFQTKFRKPRALKEVLEVTHMNQAIIKLGYLFPIYRFDHEYPAALIANLVIGGYPESKLFKVIREQYALCYDVSSNYDVYKGTLTVSSGVAIETMEDAKMAIKSLMDDIITQGITEVDLAVAKNYIIHQLKAGLDHQSYFTKRAYYAYLTQHDESIEDRIDNILKIDLKSVNEAIKRLSLDTIYVLKGGQA